MVPISTFHTSSQRKSCVVLCCAVTRLRLCRQLAASPPSPERPTCAPAATRRCILVSEGVGKTKGRRRGGQAKRRGRLIINLSCDWSAEKVTSLGKDWHRPCLRCERCSKTLSAGSHAEVRPETSEGVIKNDRNVIFKQSKCALFENRNSFVKNSVHFFLEADPLNTLVHRCQTLARETIQNHC